MSRMTTYFRPTMWAIERKWKHGAATIASLGERIGLGEIGKPATLGNYAAVDSNLRKYYFATGRALAGFMARTVRTEAIREAATATCTQFDNDYRPPLSSRYENKDPAGMAALPFRDGCRAPSEAVNVWMASGRSGDAVSFGFDSRSSYPYREQIRQRRFGFMLDESRRDSEYDGGIVATFDRFARAYPGEFATMFDGVPDPCKRSIASSIERKAREARESGVKKRVDEVSRIAKDTIPGSEAAWAFYGTKEPVVARQIVAWIVKKTREENKAKKGGMTSFSRIFTGKVDAASNPAITGAAIDLVKGGPERLTRWIRCGFLEGTKRFAPSAISGTDKDRAAKLYDDLCVIHPEKRGGSE
jgi:hypothetical protein